METAHWVRFTLAYSGVVTFLLWLLTVLLWPPFGAGILMLVILLYIGLACWKATE